MTNIQIGFVLPSPTEFIRYIAKSLILGMRAGVDTEIVVSPLVSHAKNMINKTDVILVQFEELDKDIYG